MIAAFVFGGNFEEAEGRCDATSKGILSTFTLFDSAGWQNTQGWHLIICEDVWARLCQYFLPVGRTLYAEVRNYISSSSSPCLRAQWQDLVGSSLVNGAIIWVFRRKTMTLAWVSETFFCAFWTVYLIHLKEMVFPAQHELDRHGRSVGKLR